MTDHPELTAKDIAELDQAAAAADTVLDQMLKHFNLMGFSRLAAGERSLAITMQLRQGSREHLLSIATAALTRLCDKDTGS